MLQNHLFLTLLAVSSVLVVVADQDSERLFRKERAIQQLSLEASPVCGAEYEAKVNEFLSQLRSAAVDALPAGNDAFDQILQVIEDYVFAMDWLHLIWNNGTLASLDSNPTTRDFLSSAIALPLVQRALATDLGSFVYDRVSSREGAISTLSGTLSSVITWLGGGGTPSSLGTLLNGLTVSGLVDMVRTEIASAEGRLTYRGVVLDGVTLFRTLVGLLRDNAEAPEAGAVFIALGIAPEQRPEAVAFLNRLYLILGNASSGIAGGSAAANAPSATPPPYRRRQAQDTTVLPGPLGYTASSLMTTYITEALLASFVCAGQQEYSNFMQHLQTTVQQLPLLADWAERLWTSVLVPVDAACSNGSVAMQSPQPLEGQAGPNVDVSTQAAVSALDALVHTDLGGVVADVLAANKIVVRNASGDFDATMLRESLVTVAQSFTSSNETAAYARGLITALLTETAVLPPQAIVRDVVIVVEAAAQAVASNAESSNVAQQEALPFSVISSSLRQVLRDWLHLFELQATGCGATPNPTPVPSPTPTPSPSTVPSSSPSPTPSSTPSPSLDSGSSSGTNDAPSPTNSPSPSSTSSPDPSPTPSQPPEPRVPIDGDVRLVDGTSPSYGRVEVYHNGVWGTVCDDDFGVEEASLVCLQLGYSRGSAYTHGAGSGWILLDDVDCDPLKNNRLDQCLSSGWNRTDCSHDEDVGVRCTVEEGDLRLVDGITPASGRLEIYHRGAWKTISVMNFEAGEAAVACRQLGFADGTPYQHPGGEGGIVEMGGPACRQVPQATRLADCIAVEESTFPHSADVGVRCAESAPVLGDVRIYGGLKDGIGRVELLYNGSWMSIPILAFDNADAEVVCRQLGFAGGEAAVFGWGPIILPLVSPVMCDRKIHSELWQCIQSSIGIPPSNSWSERMAGVQCREPVAGDVRLVGGEFAYDGRLEVFRRGSWRTVCDDGFGFAEATTVCQQLGHPWGLPYSRGGGEGNSILSGFSCDPKAAKNLLDCWPPSYWVYDGIPFDQGYCSHAEDVGIRCAGVPDDGKIRLVGGWSAASGRLEIYLNKTWGTVCADGFNKFSNKEATVVCRQLGYHEGYPYIAGGGMGPIIMEDVTCASNDTAHLYECPFNQDNYQARCNHQEDVGVVCLNETKPVPVNPDSAPKTLLARMYRALHTLLPGAVGELWDAVLNAAGLFPDVADWVSGRWQSGLLPHVISSQLGDAVVREVVAPVVKHLLSTNTGSVLSDAFFSRAVGLKGALDAILGSYKLVLKDWATSEALEALLGTLTNEIVTRDSRLSVEGMVADGTSVLRTLVNVTLASVGSEKGALAAALNVTKEDRELLLVPFLQSVQKLLDTSSLVLGLSEDPASPPQTVVRHRSLQQALEEPSDRRTSMPDILSSAVQSLVLDFLTEQQGALGGTLSGASSSVARVLALLPKAVGWLNQQWELAAGPLIDAVRQQQQQQGFANISLQQDAAAQAERIASVVNTAMEAFFTSGVGNAVATELDTLGILKNRTAINSGDVLAAFGASVSNPEGFVAELAQKAYSVLNSDLVKSIPAQSFFRDGLVLAQAVLQSALGATGPDGVLGQAAKTLQARAEQQADQQAVQEFLSQLAHVQDSVEQVSYFLLAYPEDPPLTVLSGSLDVFTGANVDLTATLYVTPSYRQSRLTDAGGVCAVLQPQPGLRWLQPHPMSPQYTCTSFFEQANGGMEAFLLNFGTTALGPPGPRTLKVYWFSALDGGEIAASSMVVQVRDQAPPSSTPPPPPPSSLPPAPPSSTPPPSGSSPPPSGSSPPVPPSSSPKPPPPDICARCEQCLRTLSPVVRAIYGRSELDPYRLLNESLVALASASTTDLHVLAEYMSSWAMRMFGTGYGMLTARAGFLCFHVNLCPQFGCANLTVPSATGTDTLSGEWDRCTVEGVRNGTAAYTPPSGSCRNDTYCGGALGPRCVYPNWEGMGLVDDCFPVGRCSFCEAETTKQQLLQLNNGTRTCYSYSDSTYQLASQGCDDQTQVCQYISNCTYWTCDSFSNSLVRGSCYGVCVPRTLAMVRAYLDDDGRTLLVQLGAVAAPLLPGSCDRVFDAGTTARLGGSDALCTAVGTVLAVVMAPGATLMPGESVTLLAANGSLVGLYAASLHFNGSVQVQPCLVCHTPQAVVVGPSMVAQPCDGSLPTASADFDASASTDPSGRSFISVTWAVLDLPPSAARTALQAAVNRTNALEPVRARLLLSLRPAEIAALEIYGYYKLQVTVHSWLGGSSSAVATFAKVSASAAPVVQLRGPAVQTFYIETGIRVSATVSAACTGKTIVWSWTGENAAATAVLLSAASTSTSQLYVPGRISGVSHGQMLPLRVSASYANSTGGGIQSSSAQVTMVAVGSDLIAELVGPSGDWPDNATLVFNATGSYDPDAPYGSKLQNLSVTWECSRTDGSFTTCFTTANHGDSTSSPGVWTIEPSSLQVDTWYTITVTVSRIGAETSSASASLTFRPRSASQPFPRGVLYEVCTLSGCPALHNTDQPLRVALVLADYARSASVSWSCSDIPTLGTIGQQQASSNASQQTDSSIRTLLIPAALLPSGRNTPANITITATMTLNGVEGAAKLVVRLNSPPYCGLNATSPAECLSVDVRNDTVPYAAVAVTAVGWTNDAQDEQLRYEFGILDTVTGGNVVRSRGSVTTVTLTGLHDGNLTIYVCAIDGEGARGCASQVVTIKSPPSNFNAHSYLASMDIESVASSNNLDALSELADQMSGVLYSMLTTNSSRGAGSGELVAQKAVAMANAMLTSLAAIRDPEQILQSMSSLASMAQSASELLPDSSRGVYVNAAKMAVQALLNFNTSASLSEMLGNVNTICRLLSAYLPRGKTSASGSSRRLTADAISTEVSNSRTSLIDLTSLGGQLGTALAKQATPGGGFVGGGDQGVYVAAAVLPTVSLGLGTVTLKAGPAAAAAASATSAASTTGGDAQALLVATGDVASSVSGYTVVLQYASTSSTAVSLAVTGLLDSTSTPLGGLLTVSWQAPSTASSASAPTLGGNSYVLLNIPAPGYNVAKSTACMLYDLSGSTLTKEQNSFVSYDPVSGRVTCRVTKLGSYVVTQGPAGTSSPSPSPPPDVSGSSSPPPSASPVPTKVITITILFRIGNPGRLATQSQWDAFKSNLQATLATIYQIPASSVNLASVSELRSDKTVQVVIELTVPASRSDDGGATGFQTTPMLLLPSAFLDQFTIASTVVQEGRQNNAVDTRSRTSDDDNGKKPGLSLGIIVGIAVGAAVLVLGVVVVAAVLAVRRRRHQQRVQPQDPAQLQAEEGTEITSFEPPTARSVPNATTNNFFTYDCNNGNHPSNPNPSANNNNNNDAARGYNERFQP